MTGNTLVNTGVLFLKEIFKTGHRDVRTAKLCLKNVCIFMGLYVSRMCCSGR